MARHKTHKRTSDGKAQTIARRCARHAKTGTLNHSSKSGHARVGR